MSRLVWSAGSASPLARYWNPRMAPLAPHVVDAVCRSPIASELLPGFPNNDPDAPEGYTVTPGGEIRVHLFTEMPGVTPEMVDWWFGWHSDAPERYQLWHPRAHVHAAWGRSTGVNHGYVGRISVVEEYLGAKAGRYAIAFHAPAALGLAAPDGATVVAARVGLAGWPLDAGWLAHRVTPGRMDSWFWLGGRYASIRGGGPLNVLSPLLARWMGPTAEDGRALLVHCAEEMSHLATFLPELYREWGGG